MISSQQFVVGWIEYAVAGLILLVASKLIVERLRQPVDRMNLITMCLAMSVFVPPMSGLMALPRLRLSLISNDVDRTASTQGTIRVPDPRQLPESVRNEPTVPKQSTAPQTTQKTEPVTASIAPTSPTVARIVKRFSIWSIAAVILLLSHGLATACFFLQWIIGEVRLRKLSNNATPPDQKLSDVWNQVCSGKGDSVRLLVTTEITTPMVFGWRRPVVLIPESIAKGDRPALQFCLAHEWSHVDCGDLPRWQLTNLCQCLLWNQPLFWILRRELRINQDLVADDRAVGSTGDQHGRVEYSQLLMSMTKKTMNAEVPSAMAFYDRSSQLSRRIKTLLTSAQSFRSRSTSAFYWISGILLLAGSFFVGSIRLSSVDAAQAVVVQTDDANQPKDSETQAADEEGMKIVRGRIVNESREPVAGAKLWLPLQYEPRRTVQALADDAGNFELKCPADWIDSPLSGGGWTAWAYAPGYCIQSQSVYAVIRGNRDEEYTIQLPPQSDIRFQVLTPEGKPLAGVLVKPQDYQTKVGYENVPEEMQSVLSTRTDKNGLVTLPAIQSEPLFRLEVTSEEFGRQVFRVDGNPDKEDREVRLRATASIRGQLVGEDLTWVDGVKVAFTTDGRGEGMKAEGIAVAVTDHKGFFDVPVIASGGPVRTYVSLDPKLPVRPLLRSGVYLTAGETAEIIIPLIAAPRVHGKVVAKANAEPVPNARISLGYGGFRQHDSVVTDENGEYEGRTLPGDVSVHIISMPDGFVQLGSPWEKNHEVPDGVDAFELPTIELVGTREIAGQLIDANDQPMPDLQVIATNGNRRYGFGKTNAEGRFRMSVPEGVETKTVAFLKGLGQVPVDVVTKDPLVVRYIVDDREQEMKAERSLKPDVVLVGRILRSGEPVVNVPVILKYGVPVLLASSNRKGTRYSQVSETKTDANGKYRLAGLKAGDGYQIEIKPSSSVAVPTWPHQWPYAKKLPENAESEVTLPDMNLLEMNQSIGGTVVDLDGDPVEGATISVQLRNGQHLSRITRSGPPPWTKSDHQGRFELKELPDTSLSIMAFFANPKGRRIRFPGKLDVDRNQKDIRIVLDPSLREEEEQ